MNRLRLLFLTAALLALACSEGRITAPGVDQSCGTPPDWARAWVQDATHISGDPIAGSASVNTAGTGPGRLRFTATTVSSQEDRFNSPNPGIDFRMMDFVLVTPHRGWRPNEELLLQVRHIGRVEAVTQGEGDQAFIAGGVTFRRIEATSRDGQRVISEISEVELRPIRETMEWLDFQAHVEGGASVAGFLRSAQISIQYDVSILGVVDQQGQPVPSTICFASGTRW